LICIGLDFRLRQKLNQAWCDFGDWVTFDIEPHNSGITAKPALLPNGELASPQDNRRDNLVKRHPPFKVLNHFFVAKCLQRRR
jgi:hypothetical protein